MFKNFENRIFCENINNNMFENFYIPPKEKWALGKQQF